MILAAGLLFALVQPTPQTSDFEASLAWAERVMARDLRFVGRAAEVVYRTDLSATNDALTAVLRKYGPRGATYAALARMNHHRGQNALAADNATRAVAMDPPGDARRGLAKELTSLKLTADDITEATLAPGEQIFFLRPTGQDAFIGLVATPMKYGDDGSVPTGGPEFDALSGPTLVRVRKSGDDWLTLDLFSFLKRVPPGEEAMARSVGLYWVDLDGDGSVEVVTEAAWPAASAVPTEYAVYRTATDGALAPIGRIFGPEFALVDDFDEDGKFEFGAAQAIGYGLAHAEQPRWLDVYALRDGEYRAATRDFPDVWRATDEVLVERLRAHPDDFELLEYRARCLEWSGDVAGARRALARAVTGVDQAIKRARVDFASDTAALAEVVSTLEEAKGRLQTRAEALGS